MIDDHELTIDNVAGWLQPARALFLLGQPVAVSFSPGDMTVYRMMFTPAAAVREFETHGEYPALRPGTAVLTVLVPTASSAIIADDGMPMPGYVDSHVQLKNPNTIVAVGVCWSLIVGNSGAEVAEMYGDDVSRKVIAGWGHYR